MKTEYDIKFRCATCGSEDQFEFNEDKSYIKCKMCGREYLGGIEELKKLNSDAIDSVKEEIAKEMKSEILSSFRKAFGDSKYIKIK